MKEATLTPKATMRRLSIFRHCLQLFLNQTKSGTFCFAFEAPL